VTTLREDTDGAMARWAFERAGSVPMLFNASVGVMDGMVLKGVFAFTGYNGSEVEVHYYGPGALKRHVLFAMFRLALLHFRVNRLVVRTRKASMARGVQKLGAVFEGKFKRVYGPSDGDQHAAEQFVWFKEVMAAHLGLTESLHVRQ
jgi:hypothetical protein